MSAMLQRLALKAWARLEGFPTEWYDRQRLLDWERAHADPAGDVWAISFVGDAWDLYRPGSPKEGPYSYEGVEPADQDRDWDCHCKDKTHQEDLPWARAWVERVSGKRAVDAVNGFAWPDGLCGDYVIYVRVES